MVAPPPAKIRRVTPEMTNGTPGPASRQSLGGNATLNSGQAGNALLYSGGLLHWYHCTRDLKEHEDMITTSAFLADQNHKHLNML